MNKKGKKSNLSKNNLNKKFINKESLNLREEIQKNLLNAKPSTLNWQILYSKRP